MERKTKGLTRGEILIGMENGWFKDGDEFITKNQSSRLFIEGESLFVGHSDEEPDDAYVYVDKRRYDLIEKPAYKMGDWVYEPGYSVYQIGYEPFLNELNAGVHKDMRHATPAEIAAEKHRKWWGKLRREVNEYRVGDIVAYTDGRGGDIDVVQEIRGEYVECMHDTVDIGEIRLVTPVEQRLDRPIGERSETEATD